MTQQEIQHYIDTAIRSKFKNYISQSGEMMTSEEGDGRFFGKVIATQYIGLRGREDIYLVIGETSKQLQIIKFGDTECIKPSETELDVMLYKELRIDPDA